jgi:hypothetical protein
MIAGLVRGAVAAGLLGLAGCAAAPQLALPPEPVAVAGRGQAQPVSRLHTEIVVRAFFDDTGALREVGNADCRLSTETFEAAFTSPGRVVVPVFAVGAPVLEVVCAAEGREGRARQPLLRRWIGSPPPGWRDDLYWGDPWGRPRWGPWDGGGWPGDVAWRGGWWGPGPYGVFYPDIRVVMR